jgi:NADPH-dependent curcumin reductase CurA
MRGFIVGDKTAEHDPIFYREVPKLLASGEVKYKEDVVQGSDKVEDAFIGLLEGKNMGKLVVRISSD